MLISQFINVAVVLNLASLNIVQFGSEFIEGNYQGFSVAWYQTVGTAICTTLAAQVVSF